MWPWVKHLTLPCSFIFHFLPQAVLSTWTGFLDLASKSQILIKCCPGKPSLIPLSQISFFLTPIPILDRPYLHYIIYHMALLLLTYHPVYFSWSCYFMAISWYLLGNMLTLLLLLILITLLVALGVFTMCQTLCEYIISNCPRALWDGYYYFYCFL